MTDIRVTTTVEITDNLGRRITSVTQTASAKPGDNGRYFATYARGAIQATEHAIANMLIAEYGDTPE